MKIEQQEVIIPEHKKIVEKYIADDGAVFTSRYLCEQYEKELAVKSNPLLTKYDSEICGYSTDSARLFYIVSEQDIEWLKIKGIISESLDENDFPKCGCGWYIYFGYDDSCEGRRLKHVLTYLREIDKSNEARIKYAQEWREYILALLVENEEDVGNGTE